SAPVCRRPQYYVATQNYLLSRVFRYPPFGASRAAWISRTARRGGFACCADGSGGGGVPAARRHLLVCIVSSGLPCTSPHRKRSTSCSQMVRILLYLRSNVGEWSHG